MVLKLKKLHSLIGGIDNFMKSLVLTISFILFFIIGSFSQCKEQGLYVNYGVGTTHNGGTSMTIEFGYPRLTSTYFLTGIVGILDTKNKEFYHGYGVQFNKKTHIGNNDLIQYVNVMNSVESYSKKSMISGTLGVKWLQRIYKDDNFFLVGNFGYREWGFGSFKQKNVGSGLISEIGFVFVL